MADSTNVEPPPQPQPGTSSGTQAQPDETTISTPDNHNDTASKPSDQSGSIKTENMAEGASNLQDIAPTTTDAALAPAAATPTPAPALESSHSSTMTPVPAANASASTPAAGSRAQTPAAAAAAPIPPVKAEAAAPQTAAAAASTVAMPAEPANHGAPTRVYLNAKVTQHLMEGMKLLALNKPDQPLRVLGQFLLERSAQIEGPFPGDGAGAGADAADESMDDVEQ